jgi:hypothetical protein
MKDVDDIIAYITNEYNAPLTAKRYLIGLFNRIDELQNSAESIQISHYKTILQYGKNVRRINYKKLAIIYTVKQNVVTVRRIMAGALVNK